MKVELEVELPEHIAKDWEVVKIAMPVDGEYLITSFGDVVAFVGDNHQSIPRIILRRKLNPREWWPEWIKADEMLLARNGDVVFSPRDNRACLVFAGRAFDLIDMSWIPEHLKRSGITIENPWKGEKQ